MAIIDKDGYKFLDNGKNGCCDFIVFESNRKDEYCEYINQNKINSIYFCDLFYEDSNIDILEKCPKIENINIYSTEIIDYTGMYSLINLKSLYCNDVRSSINLSAFRLLEELAIELNKKVSGISSCTNLRKLLLWKYNPKSENLQELSHLTNIEELIITQSKISSLVGCKELKKLKKLELNFLSKLEYIDELEQNTKTLKHLRFDSCKRIQNHEYVVCLKELELLAFDSCGHIQTISFIRSLPKLKQFIFMNTNVVDGDISPCEGLEYVAFTNKKNFSHNMQYFKK